MIPGRTQAIKKNLLIILMASIATLLNGCNSCNFSTPKSLISKSIIEILVNEDDTSWNCIITGNDTLTFSAINHISPTGILLYFPDTTIDISAADPIVPPNEIIGSIEATEFMDGNLTTSRILVGLNMDRPYNLSPEENGVKISFPKSLVRPVNEEPIKIPAELNETVADERDYSSASLLKTVTATTLTNHIIVNVVADGTIANYDSFSIDHPARIVFDIYNITSPKTGGQALAVNSPWVNRIRYTPHPDKIRLVLDTEKRFLTNYFSFPTARGMLIYVGRMPEPLGKK